MTPDLVPGETGDPEPRLCEVLDAFERQCLRRARHQLWNPKNGDRSGGVVALCDEHMEAWGTEEGDVIWPLDGQVDTLERLYRAVLATANVRVANAHPDDPADYELQQAILETERTLRITP